MSVIIVIISLLCHTMRKWRYSEPSGFLQVNISRINSAIQSFYFMPEDYFMILLRTIIFHVESFFLFNLILHYFIISLLRADVATATVLISMGALLGNTSYVQLIIMGAIEIAVFSANSYLGTEILKVRQFPSYFAILWALIFFYELTPTYSRP